MESIQQTFNGTGSRITAQISRNGDLLHKLYLVFKGATVTTASNYTGHELIDKVEIEIGGQLIDRQYGEWMNIWNELTLPFWKDSWI